MRAGREPDYRPVLLGDVDLCAPLQPLTAGRDHRSARLLIRLHGHAVGEIHVELTEGTMPAGQLADQVWAELAGRVRAHLATDGLPVPDRLTADGIDATGHDAHPCWPARAMQEQPPMTVVIATRDRTESLLRTLQSVAALDYPDFDVVVVDSSPSSTQTRDVLHRAAPYGLRCTYVPVARPGLARAHNAAIPHCREFAAITDDDVEVDRMWLAGFAESFATGKDVVCVTGLILPAELATPAQLLIEEAGGFSRGFRPRRFSLAEAPAEPLFPYTAGRFGSGANMAFRTSWLRAAGGFDEATGAGSRARGGDDLTAFLRVIRDGAALDYQPSAVVRHWHRREMAGLRRNTYNYGVGLGAYLTASVVHEPKALAGMLRRAPGAVRHLLGPTSVKNRGKSASFPAELTWLERAGVAAGPAAYAASRWTLWREDRKALQ